ncbi:MAG: tetratricopeptide repeat protein [Candidatus Eisenbacteria bacterium]
MAGRKGQDGRRDGALLFVLALAAGFVNWRFLSADFFLSYPIIDAAEYLAEAKAIVRGLPYWRAVPIHGPVYPLFLVPFDLLFRSPLAPVFLAQILLTAGAAVLVRSAGVRLGGRLHGNIAGGLVALAPPLLYFQVQALPVSLQVFLHAAMLRFLVVRDPGDRRALALAGILGGLSYMTHPGAGLALAAVGVFVLVKDRPFPSGGLFLSALALTLLPVSFLNLRAGEGPWPVTGNAGLNLYVGNGPHSDGTPHVRPGYEWERLTSMPLLAGIEGSAEESRFFLNETADAWREDPAGFIGRIAAKALLFGSGFPIDASHDAAYFAERSPPLRLFFLDAWIVVPLALGFLALGRAWSGPWPQVGLGVLGYWVGTAATVFSIRYRAPAWPFLALLAAALPALRPRPSRREIGKGAVVAAALLAAALLDPFSYRGKNPVRIDYQIGRLQYDRRNFEEARRSFLDLWEETEDPDAANALGAVALAVRGEEEEAGIWFRRALEAAPDYADAHFNLGLWMILRGWADEGEGEIDEAIRLAPGHGAALYTKGILLEGRGESAEAERFYRLSLSRDPTRADGWNALGVLFAKSGRRAEAEECFLRAWKLDPESPETRMNLERLRGNAPRG